VAEPTASVLRQLAEGKLPQKLPAGCAYPEELSQLICYLSEVQRLALAISRGELAAPIALSGKGPVLGSLKALQASLRHLTWQSQQVAAGDLSQRVDFMGDFADAFNEMVRQLEERKKMEVRLRQAQKLEAIGQLAAGIAHEINTPLNTYDNLDFLKDAFGNLFQFDSISRVARGAGPTRPGIGGHRETEKSVTFPGRGVRGRPSSRPAKAWPARQHRRRGRSSPIRPARDAGRRPTRRSRRR
jgi:signal transduction histidine kinase